MDDDSIRRGKPSAHVKFGEATAVLAGNSLLTMAFEILSHKDLRINEKTKIDLINKISESSGHLGIAGGQYLDLNYERKKISQKKIEKAYNNLKENLGVEKQFISSLLELIGEEKVEKPINQEKGNINQMDDLPNNQILDNFNLIDKSLENLLLNLSYNINQELFKANLISKMISKDSFDYLVGKNLMIKHPYAFVINFEFNLNRSSLNDNNLQNIIFFNISCATSSVSSNNWFKFVLINNFLTLGYCLRMRSD